MVSCAAVPARRGSCPAPVPPHSPCSSAGDAESNMMPSYWPSATCVSSDVSQYCANPDTETFMRSFWSAELVTRCPLASCQNHVSFIVTVG